MSDVRTSSRLSNQPGGSLSWLRERHPDCDMIGFASFSSGMPIGRIAALTGRYLADRTRPRSSNGTRCRQTRRRAGPRRVPVSGLAIRTIPPRLDSTIDSFQPAETIFRTYQFGKHRRPQVAERAAYVRQRTELGLARMEHWAGRRQNCLVRNDSLSAIASNPSVLRPVGRGSPTPRTIAVRSQRLAICLIQGEPP